MAGLGGLKGILARAGGVGACFQSPSQVVPQGLWGRAVSGYAALGLPLMCGSGGSGAAGGRLVNAWRGAAQFPRGSQGQVCI